LWLIARTGGEAVPLTGLPMDIGAFAWSPDGKRIAFIATDPDTPSEQHDKTEKRDWIEVDHDRHFSRLWVLDLATRVARRVSPDGMTVSGLDWSPDGTRLALRVADANGINDFFYHSRVVLFDPGNGRVGATLIDHVADDPKWSPDGRRILAEQIRTPGFIGLVPVVHDVASGRATELAADHPGLVTDARWSPDGRSIVALSFEHTRSYLVRIAIEGGTVTRLASFDGQATSLSLSRDGRRLAVALTSPDHPAEVWTLAQGTPRRLTDINPQVAHWRLGRVQEVSWQNHADHRTIYGVLVTPPGASAGTKLPMVVQVHSGPEWAWWAGWLGSWAEWAQMLATHGYAVLLPNPRGSDGQGTDFARAVGADWGGMDYQDILDGVDLMVARHIADPDRLGIGGWSYGGFMAAWAVTHTNRFKAAVAGAAPSDLVAFARITDTPDFPLGYLGDVTTHMAGYDAISSARMLQAVRTPLLVLHGEADTRVPITLGLELYRGLKMRGATVAMVRYPREPHWFHEPAHQADVQQRVLDWFDTYLTAKPSAARP
jgi:dipeptidyl aminopeptidase/acylaminoacyl peptidase